MKIPTLVAALLLAMPMDIAAQDRSYTYSPSGTISTNRDCYEYDKDEIVITFTNSDHAHKDDWMGIYEEPFRLRRLWYPEMW
jgi:hypothetical protein